RCATDGVCMVVSKLQVVAAASVPEHYAVKTVVIFELAKNVQTESIAVELYNCGEIVRWAGDPQVRLSDGGRLVHVCALLLITPRVQRNGSSKAVCATHEHVPHPSR